MAEFRGNKQSSTELLTSSFWEVDGKGGFGCQNLIILTDLLIRKSSQVGCIFVFESKLEKSYKQKNTNELLASSFREIS